MSIKKETIELLDFLITSESDLTEEQRRTLLELRENVAKEKISSKEFKETCKEIARWLYYFFTEW